MTGKEKTSFKTLGQEKKEFGAREKAPC